MSSDKAGVKCQEAVASRAATSAPATPQLSPPSLAGYQEDEPPQYFDSEPSSQPPSYGKHCGNAFSSKRNSGPASAASVAAILGPPPETHRKVTLKERWRDLIHNGETSGADKPDLGSAHSATYWNIGQARFLSPKNNQKG